SSKYPEWFSPRDITAPRLYIRATSRDAGSECHAWVRVETTTSSQERVRVQLPQEAAAGLRRRLEAGEAVLGCFLSLGSAVTAEIMGTAGYDWALIDLEHGAGGEPEALSQMQALAAAGCAAVVRVEGGERQRTHRVLDFGAHGIMFPRVDTPEEAAQAVAAMRYPPTGVRGVAFSNRACLYGSNMRPYMDGSMNLLTIVQIESPQAVANAHAIAAVDGVDVLFIGPSDLSHSMGGLGQFDRPDFIAAIRRTAEAAKAHGKHSGLLLPSPADYGRYYDQGYRFIASGSDAVLLNNAARALVQGIRKTN
ncbi:MAG TPA: aldolase/citrate lyase family protein, partial [Bryobacteraceae bacterium]|nr:aldolase/citrate lyase family protein [Bryobacteraceae bacterium]